MNKFLKYFICLWLIAISLTIFNVNILCQNIKVYITVIDSINKKSLSGAIVNIAESGSSRISDNEGKCSIFGIRGLNVLKCSFVGYKNFNIPVNLKNDTSLFVYLIPLVEELKEITILSTSAEKNVNNVQNGVVSLNRKEINSLPVLLGESDFFKALQLLPGIQNSGEGNAAINVRGGGNDQNLILLDGAVVYNPSHLLGFYSIFNTDVIKDVTLIKSGIPAEYGNRISSVMDFNSRFEIPKKTVINGNLGFISARIAANVPLFHDKGCIFFAGRSTYINLLLSIMKKVNVISGNSILRKSGYNFYDLNGGIYLNLNKNNKLILSVYNGKDDFDIEADIISLNARMAWSNGIASLTWNHLFNNHFSMENRIVKSTYDYKMDFTQSQYTFHLTSNIRDIGLKNKLYFYSDHHKIKFGFEILTHRINPNSSLLSTENQVLTIPKQYQYNSLENSIYFSDEIKLSDQVSIVTGLRGNSFSPLGPYISYNRDSEGNVSDSTAYPSGKIVNTYFGFEPRLAFRYLLSEKNSIKLSYNFNNQYIHLVNASSVSFPTDFWIPSTKKIKPQRGSQISLGYYKNFDNNNFQTSIELYYKNLTNQMEFKNSIFHVFDNTPFDENLVFGKGRSYGAELLIKKTTGRITGWIGYTLSKTEKSFAEIENKHWFPAKYDRTHDASCVINFDFSNKWIFSTVFVFSTGSAYTPVVGRFFIENNIVNIYGRYNSARMPDYHRLDISATYIITKTEVKDSRIIFSIFNVYNRQNPFFIYPQAVGSIFPLTLSVHPEEVSIFPILPSVSWQFMF